MNVRVSGVILENDAVLLIRHNYKDEQLWHIPGGNVRKHETLTAALKREFSEELDLIIEIGELWLVCDNIRPDGVHVLHCVFIAKREEASKPTIQKEKTSGIEYQWVLVTNLSSLRLYPSIGTYIQHLVTGYPKNLPSAKYIGRCHSKS